MPNYNLVVTAKYRPYTFDEMAKPLMMYKADLDKQTEQALALSDEAAKRMSFLDPSVDSEQYMQYKAATDEVNSLADDLATNGLSTNSLARAARVRRTLQNLITPLDYAIKNREKDKELFMEMKLKHPEIQLSRDPYKTPISSYYPNADTPELKTLNLNDLYTQAKGISQSFASQFSDADIRRINDMFFKYVKEVGIKGDPDSIMKSKDYPEFEEMRKRLEDSIDFSGFSKDQVNLAKTKILQGFKDGILSAYSSSSDIKTDPTAATRMKLGIAQAVKAQKDAEKAAKNGEDTLLGAYKAKESTIRVKHYPTDDKVREAAKHAEELLTVPGEMPLTEFEKAARDKMYEWSTGEPGMDIQFPIIGNPGTMAKPIIEKGMGKYYNAFEPISKEIVSGRDKDGNYTETTRGIADYRLNLNNLPEKMQKDFIDTFNALGIKVTNGMHLSTLRNALDKATKIPNYALDETTGKITKTSIDQNLNFGAAQMIQLKMHPSVAKQALSNYILELVDGDEFYAGSVKEVKGAKTVDGRYVGSMSFKDKKVSATKFKEALKNADAVKMYAYTDDDNSGIIVNIGDGKEYFIDTAGSQSMNSFTNTLVSTDLKQVAKNADKGFSYGGKYIPYTSLLNSPSVRQVIDAIDQREKYKAFLSGAGGAMFTEEEKTKELKKINAEIKDLKNQYIYPNQPQFGKINDIIQAMESSVAYAKYGDALSMAFSDANFSGYKGTAYKQDASTSQFIKYTGDPIIDAYLSDTEDEESNYED